MWFIFYYAVQDVVPAFESAVNWRGDRNLGEMGTGSLLEVGEERAGGGIPKGSPVKMRQQLAILPPSVNFLPLTPHWTSLGAL